MAISATARERRMPLFEEPDPLDEPVRATVELPRRRWNQIDAIVAREGERQRRRVSRWAVIDKMLALEVAIYERDNGPLEAPVGNGRKRGKK